jgi:hypothetical protein
MPGSGIPDQTKMFFATVTLPFLRAVACFTLLDQICAPTVRTLNI